MSDLPKLRAEFLLDDDGEPLKAKDGKLTHYEIKLWIEDVPTGAYGVTYDLHDTYYDPKREVFGASGDFAEEITSYGDFEVRAKVRTRSATCTVKEQLSSALERNYAGNASPAIVKALTAIKDN
jgi:hypothetical protein